jgi:hypothetical protein
MFRKMLIGALALVALAAAPAAAQYNLDVGGELVPGGEVTVSGDSCAFDAEVEVRLTQLTSDRAVGDTTVVATGTADGEGNYDITFQLPADLEPGTYEISVYCNGAFVRSAQVQIQEAGTATTQPGSGSGGGPIVRTGSDLNGLGLVGIGLLTVGGIILIATKTRRHASA